MENREVIDGHLSTGTLVVTEEIKKFLQETAKWTKFLAIFGFVLLALYVIMAIYSTTVLGSVFDGIGGSSNTAGVFQGVGIFNSIFTFLIMFFPLYYLMRFSTKMKLAITNDEQEILSEAFKNLKRYFKFLAILVIVMLALIVFGLVSFIFLDMSMNN